MLQTLIETVRLPQVELCTVLLKNLVYVHLAKNSGKVEAVVSWYRVAFQIAVFCWAACKFGFSRISRIFLKFHQLFLPSVRRHCWLGGRKGIWPVKKSSGEVLAWLSVWSEVPLPLTVSCVIKIQAGFNLSGTGPPGQRAVRPVCVCMPRYRRQRCGLLLALL